MAYQLLQGDNRQVLRTLPDQSVHCIVTSPPYFDLRDYGVDGQIGLEATPAAYVAELVTVFRECWRVLRDDGTLWVNLGDSYIGSANSGGDGNRGDGGIPYQVKGLPPKKMMGLQPKNLMMIPHRVAMALQADGWIVRADIVWAKPNPMPESVTDRPTKAHEYIFLLTKSQRYYYDADAVKEPASFMGSRTWDERKADGEPMRYGLASAAAVGAVGGFKNDSGYRNRRSVWTVATQPYPGAHFATFPPALIEPCILAGCLEGGTVLDPFNGSGTTGAVACAHNRNYIGIDLSAAYIELAHARIREAIRDSGRAYVAPVCKPTDFADMPLFGGAN